VVGTYGPPVTLAPSASVGDLPAAPTATNRPRIESLIASGAGNRRGEGILKIVAIVALVAVAIVLVVVMLQAPQPGRYVYVQAPGGFLVVDSSTGTIYTYAPNAAGEPMTLMKLAELPR
jgi:hypothetical protein